MPLKEHDLFQVLMAQESAIQALKGHQQRALLEERQADLAQVAQLQEQQADQQLFHQIFLDVIRQLHFMQLVLDKLQYVSHL